MWNHLLVWRNGGAFFYPVSESRERKLRENNSWIFSPFGAIYFQVCGDFTLGSFPCGVVPAHLLYPIFLSVLDLGESGGLEGENFQMYGKETQNGTWKTFFKNAFFLAEGSIPFTKSPSLFSFRGQVRSGHGTKPNIPIVIVSDENGKRVMGGKEMTTIYQKQDLEEILWVSFSGKRDNHLQHFTINCVIFWNLKFHFNKVKS